ncbi:MAG TPA: hypothetical protein VH538_12885 [Gaiellaceae bacterium]
MEASIAIWAIAAPSTGTVMPPSASAFGTATAASSTATMIAA